MVGLLIEDVTLTKTEQITAHVRFRGGAATLTLPLSLGAWADHATTPAAVAEIDTLLSERSDRPRRTTR